MCGVAVFALALTASSGASAQVTAPGCTSTFQSSGAKVNPNAAFAQIIGGVTGAANSMTSVIGTMNTAFLAQGNAFVASLPDPKPDQTAGGVWGRMIGGRVDTHATGTFNGTITPGVPNPPFAGGSGQITCKSDIRQDYAGFQLGQDLARLNLGGGGANVHVGVTAGYAESNAQDLGGSNFTGGFEIPFVGLYSTFSQGNFFADVLARWDFFQMSLYGPDAALANQRLDGNGFSVAGSAGYKIDVGSNWFVEPSIGAIHSTVKIDALNMPGGFGNLNNPFFLPPGTVQFSDIESTLGRAGVRVGTSFTTGSLALQPFATVSVWHEFAGNTAATYHAPPFVALNGPGNEVTGTLAGSRVGTYGQYSLGFAGQLIDSNWLGYLRADYKNGANIESLSLNGGLRYQFDPSGRTVVPVKGVYKAPPRVAVAYDWSGFYVGGFAGMAWGDTKWSFPAAGSQADPNVAGALTGAEVGYNRQVGAWVVGVEGDIAATNARGGQSCVDGIFNVAPAPIAANCNNDVRWLATATARLGYTWDRVLVYAKGGGAWTDGRLDASCNGDAFFPQGACIPSNQGGVGGVQDLIVSDSRSGWTAGAGVEIGLTQNWSAKVEYDHLDFGSRNITLPDTTLVNLKESTNEVKVGVNYRLGPSEPDDVVAPSAAAKMPRKAPLKAPPPAAFNWAGTYIGVSVGDRLSETSWSTVRLPNFTCFDCLDVTTSQVAFFSATVRPGGYIGFNWQVAPKWVAGLEGDIAWGRDSMTQGGIPGTFGNGNNSFVGIEAEGADSAAVKLGWDGSARARIGMAPNPSLLIYATGGVAFQKVDVTATCDGTFNSWCSFGAKSQTFSSVRTGWTAGAGVEGALTSNLAGRLEFRYADYGHFDNTFFAKTGDDVVTSVRVQTLTLLAGLDYKLDWARPFAAK